MNYRNMKIGKKLALSFGLIIALLLVLAAFASSRVNVLSREISLTNDDRYPKTVLAQTIKNELNETARNMRNILLMSDAGAIAQEYQNIEESSKRIGESIAKLEQTVSSAQGRTQMAALLQDRQKFLAARGAFLALAKDGKKEQATDYLGL
jgi:methyl-accepting chemotaxis protein